MRNETAEAHQSSGATAVAALLRADVRPEAERLNESLLDYGSDVVPTEDGQLQLRRPDQRMAAAVTFEGGEQIPTLLIERPDGRALNMAEELRETSPGRVDIRVTGTAHSGWPEESVRTTGCSLQPGASIGHYAGWAGSLGCLVSIGSGRRSSIAVLGAAHVLGNVGAAEAGDRILCPCPPDGPRVMGGQIATLADATLLVHYKNLGGRSRATNTADAAIAVLVDQDGAPQTNLVPDPSEPRKKIRLKGHVPDDNLPRYEGQEVYKVGRTTGFRRGVFAGITTETHSIRLPDNRIYFYQGTLIVENAGRRAFSQPGDSGAVVYTRDGLVLGLVIGAAKQMAFVSPITLCLQELNAAILT